MLQKQSNNLQPLSKKRVDAEEMAKALQRLPEAERQKLYYMIKGIELIHNNTSVGLDTSKQNQEQREVC